MVTVWNRVSHCPPRPRFRPFGGRPRRAAASAEACVGPGALRRRRFRGEWTNGSRRLAPRCAVGQAADFQAREVHWARMSSVGPGQEVPRDYAADQIFDETWIPSTLRSTRGRVFDHDQAARGASAAARPLCRTADPPPGGLHRGRAVVASLTAIGPVARTVAEQNAEKVLPRVDHVRTQSPLSAGVDP